MEDWNEYIVRAVQRDRNGSAVGLYSWKQSLLVRVDAKLIGKEYSFIDYIGYIAAHSKYMNVASSCDFVIEYPSQTLKWKLRSSSSITFERYLKCWLKRFT